MAQQQSLVPAEVITQNDAEKRQIELVKEKFDPTKYNQIFHTSTVVDMLPAGVELIPSVVNIPQHELWDKATDSKLSFLKDGMVELSAPAIKRIGMVAGVKLEKVTELVKEVNKVQYLLIEYRASMQLPDGSVHWDIAGKEEPYAGQHAREKIDTKAKRNAIKALLNIPLTLPREHVNKPFVVFKPVFRRGYSPETDAILDRIEGAKANAMDMLYGSSKPELKALPSTNQDSGEVGLAELTEMMRTAPDLAQLETLVQAGMTIKKDEMERKAWLEAMQKRKAELEGPKL